MRSNLLGCHFGLCANLEDTRDALAVIKIFEVTWFGFSREQFD